MRDDIDGVHKDNEYRYYTEDPTRFIYNYNDEQLKTSTYFNSPITKAGRTFYHGFKMDDEETPSNRFNVHQRIFMSQDEVAPLFLSLALVAKLVDDNRLFTDTEGEQVTIGRWCGKIAYRTMKALYNGNTNEWNIYNPVTLENLPDHNDFNDGGNGTNTYWMSAGFQIAAAYILQKDNSTVSLNEIEEIQQMTNPESFYIRYNLFANSFYFIYYYSIHKSSDLIPVYLAMLCPYLCSFDDITQVMKHNTWLAGNKISFEFYPMFYSLLHDVDMEDEWNNNYMTYNNYLDSLEMLLDVMPECGSYALDYKHIEGDEEQHLLKNISGYYYYADRIRNLNKIRSDNQCEKTDYKTKINSNLDYLILYNLYYLLIKDDLDNYLSSYNANQDFPTNPYRPYGSHSNPALIYGQEFQLNHTVFEEGDVTIIAEDYIELLPGFEVKEGGTFIGEIGVYNPNCNFNYSGSPLCEPDKNSDFEVKNKENFSISKEITNENEMFNYTIYPNPVAEELNICLSSENDVNMIQLIDFSGKIVEEIFQPKLNTNINFSNQPVGLYFLIIKCNNQIYTEKIIKN